jgi:hypothetical protein
MADAAAIPTAVLLLLEAASLYNKVRCGFHVMVFLFTSM